MQNTVVYSASSKSALQDEMSDTQDKIEQLQKEQEEIQDNRSEAMKTVENLIYQISDVEKEIEIRSLDPESVSIAIALYIYFTILVNNSLDALSYNELFIKSYHDYYNYWMSRRLMLQMHGNSWKNDFNGVLLA